MDPEPRTISSQINAVHRVRRKDGSTLIFLGLDLAQLEADRIISRAIAARVVSGGMKTVVRPVLALSDPPESLACIGVVSTDLEGLAAGDSVEFDLVEGGGRSRERRIST